jgi:triacylglycerol lipase
VRPPVASSDNSAQFDWAGATEAALNAMIGDYLERRGNGLAIEMAFYHRGQRLPLNLEALRLARPDATPKIAILVHGMAHTEGSFSYVDDPATDYGSQLEADLGFTSYYLRYNTGRHVSENGRELALLLERLMALHPVAPMELTLIGHSMGGLVIRSACHYASELGLSWLELARRAIYIGSPHLGAPLEKGGHLVSLVLGAIPNPVVRLIGAVANLRSAGVKDLRHGSIVDDDWHLGDGAPWARPQPIPLGSGIEHYLVAGTLTQNETHILGQLFGDALVRVASATDPSQKEGFPPDHVAIFPGQSHMNLAHDANVYLRLRSWCADPNETRSPRPTERCTSDAASVAEARRNRIEGYRALVEDAVDAGASAVQQVHEELTAGPYDWVQRVPPLEVPAKVVRTVHFALLRSSYQAVRRVNRAVGAVLGAILERS